MYFAKAMKEEDLTCKRCRMNFTSMIFLCKEGHSFCSDCKEVKKTCSICNQNIVYRNLVAEELVKYLYVESSGHPEDTEKSNNKKNDVALSGCNMF